MSNSQINKIIDAIIETEGGYIDHPADKGGPTKYGITLKTLEHHLGYQIGLDNVKELDKGTAREIYFYRYFKKPGLDILPDHIQHLMLDMSVNHGPANAVRILQEELQHDGYEIGKIDGIIGPKTRRCTYRAAHDHGLNLINMIVKRRKLFYRAIVDRDPSQRVFIDGWIARAERFIVDLEASHA